MRKTGRLLMFATALALLSYSASSCSDKIEEEILQEKNVAANALPEYFTALLPQNDETRINHTLDGKNVKTAWSIDDVITISPAHQSQYANVYKLTAENGATGTFEKVSGDNVNTNSWGVYYPGNKIKSDIDFFNFSYSGQVQQKSDPMAHMAQFHSMMLGLTSSGSGVFPETNAIDFSSAQQSSCIRFVLGGQTFETPQSISISIVDQAGFVSPAFYENNIANGSFYGDGGKPYNGGKQTAVLTLGLDGYGSESSLDALLMTSNANVTLPAGGYALIRVKCASSAYFCKVPIKTTITISGGRILTITSNGKWYEDTVPYDNTEYSYDGEVVTVQEVNTNGNCLDLVVMGDGFIAEDITNGTYRDIMMQAIDEFFSIQPINKFENEFNIYWVKAVSPQRLSPSEILLNGAKGNGTITKFSTVLQDGSTHIGGNTNLINEYAKKALGANANERIKNATVVVMVNAACHAGTCWNSYSPSSTADYGESNAVAFCALGANAEDRKQLMYHEICGHGFGKLADEYYYDSYLVSPSNKITELQNNHNIGLFRNVDGYTSGYTTTSTVYWHDLFGTANDYETKEALGVFEGAYTYCRDFCRPTEDGNKSIMNYNTGCFNAISRRQILYRLQRLSNFVTANDFGTPTELNRFLDWDQSNFVYPVQGETRANSVEQFYPIEPAKFVAGEWVNGFFIEGVKMN